MNDKETEARIARILPRHGRATSREFGITLQDCSIKQPFSAYSHANSGLLFIDSIMIICYNIISEG